MSAKPETTFINALHKKLPRSVYHMKNNNAYTGGIPDVWYSGNYADLWVEYKYIAKLPVRVPIDPMKLLSPLQQQWLRDRYKQGRNIAVVVGCPTGGVVLTDGYWEESLTSIKFNSLIKSKKELAAWIVDQVGI